MAKLHCWELSSQSWWQSGSTRSSQGTSERPGNCSHGRAGVEQLYNLCRWSAWGGCCIQPVLKQQMMRNGQAQWKLRHRLLMAQRRRPTNWYTFAMLKIGSTQIAGHFRLPVFWPHPSVAVICCWSFATMSVCIAHLMPRQLLPPPRIIPPKEGIMVDIIIQYTIYHSISSTRILHFYHFLSVYLNMLSRIFM